RAPSVQTLAYIAPGSQLQQQQQQQKQVPSSAVDAMRPAIGGNSSTTTITTPLVIGDGVSSVKVENGNKVTLECRVDGNPIPWIVGWFRNGLPMRVPLQRLSQAQARRNQNSTNTSITTKPKRVSIITTSTTLKGSPATMRGRRTATLVTRLMIERANDKNDTGYYECRAMNVLAREPAVGRFRVLVLHHHTTTAPAAASQHITPSAAANSSSSTFVRSPYNHSTDNKDSHLHRHPHNMSMSAINLTPALSTAKPHQHIFTVPDIMITPTHNTILLAATTTTTISVPTTPAATYQTIRTTTTTATIARTATTPVPELETAAPGPPEAPSIGRPCPNGVNEAFCLNNGTCTYLENIRESICICAAGYIGLRCEFKSIKSHR
ncbi:hypothetical protein GZH46_01232, partial [Fragariocoptes setiger]